MQHPTRTVAVAAVITLAGLTGCTHATNPTPTPTPAQTTATSPATVPTTPTPTPTPSVSTKEQADAKKASDTVVAFWKLHDELAQNSKRSVNELDTLSKGETNRTEKNVILGYRAKETHQVGNRLLKVASSTYVGGDAWEIKGCSDVTKVDVQDHAGKSVVAPGRPNFWVFTDRVERAEDGKLYIVQDRAEKAEAC